jgi:hypothetical protein
MRLLVFCAALAAAAPALAADILVARNGQDTVRLVDAPCASEAVLSRLPPQQHANFKAATATVDGKSYSACWRTLGGRAHLFYEDGDMGVIPMSDLRAELST